MPKIKVKIKPRCKIRRRPAHVRAGARDGDDGQCELHHAAAGPHRLCDHAHGVSNGAGQFQHGAGRGQNGHDHQGHGAAGAGIGVDAARQLRGTHGGQRGGSNGSGRKRRLLGARAAGASQVPDTVQNLSITAGDSAGELDFQWDPASGASSYDVHVSPDPVTATSWAPQKGVTKSKAAFPA